MWHYYERGLSIIDRVLGVLYYVIFDNPNLVKGPNAPTYWRQHPKPGSIAKYVPISAFSMHESSLNVVSGSCRLVNLTSLLQGMQLMIQAE